MTVQTYAPYQQQQQQYAPQQQYQQYGQQPQQQQPSQKDPFWYRQNAPYLYGVTNAPSNMQLGIENISLKPASANQAQYGIMFNGLMRTVIGGISFQVRLSKNNAPFVQTHSTENGVDQQGQKQYWELITLNVPVKAQILRFAEALIAQQTQQPMQQQYGMQQPQMGMGMPQTMGYGQQQPMYGQQQQQMPMPQMGMQQQQPMQQIPQYGQQAPAYQPPAPQNMGQQTPPADIPADKTAEQPVSETPAVQPDIKEDDLPI